MGDNPGCPFGQPGATRFEPSGFGAEEAFAARSSTVHCPLSDPVPDPEGITAHSRSVEDRRDDTTGSLF